MTITSLIDDFSPKRGLRGEHGLSLYIEAGATKLLFDTGQGGTFMENARTIGIDLTGLDAVVLSHGHYDHGGGVSDLYRSLEASLPPFFAGRGFDAVRSSRSGTRLMDIGLPVPALPPGAPLAVITTFEEFAPGVWFLPAAELVDGAEANPKFRIFSGDVEGIDHFDDELSLVFDEEDGIVIVTGCAHRGILNIARAAMRSFPGRPVKAIVGGFHLVDAEPETLSRVAAGIAAIAPKAVFCAHCTGPRGFAALSEGVQTTVAWLSCGLSITL